MTGPVLGVDIGVSGALALLAPNGGLIDVFDMPVLNDGPAGRRAINAPLLAEIVARAHATEAFVETVGPRLKEGAVGAFAFGPREEGTRIRVYQGLRLNILGEGESSNDRRYSDF